MGGEACGKGAELTATGNRVDRQPEQGICLRSPACAPSDPLLPLSMAHSSDDPFTRVSH